ncbi:MAG: hypothetical protein LBM67_01015 [Lentimicrobiaceae bacterium]|jgi:hypothetical protein|nr:hypothetical protein [Lentimicrobiaceae bacterium]
MKKSKFIFLTALSVACASLLLSCKKDTATKPDEIRQNFSSEAAKEVWQTINTFFETRQMYKTGLKTDNGTVTIDRAREILDRTINYYYGNPTQNAPDKTLDTIRVAALTPDTDGNVNFNEVIETFDAFSTTIALREDLNSEIILNYFAVQFPNSNNTRNNDSITIVYSRGLLPEDPITVEQVPFGSDDNWIWGFDRGHCDKPNITYSDAAQELTKKFIYTPAENTPAENDSDPITINFNWDIEYITYLPEALEVTNECFSENNYWLFYLEGENLDPYYCIDNNMMNCYWKNIRNNIVWPSGIFHYSETLHSPYRECYINSWQENSTSIEHQVEVLYFKTGYIY